MNPKIVDLHVHSHYSRATSKNMNIEDLYWWAKVKGINVLGTGDFTHPLYFQELREKLEPAEPGLFKLKHKLAQKQDKKLPKIIRNSQLRFILSVEISNIYTRDNKGRRLHNLIILPSFELASDFNRRLERIGNLKSDGRPILGLDSHDLLAITLETSKKALFIPAHIWTPWFAMFGSKSGFDTIADAFGDLASEIKAVETGLSSDPFMNWRLSALDNITLISNSDAHSPAKLGREANLINTAFDYDQIVQAIKTNDDRFVGTIEFFPQEGKYHLDGHRKCKLRFTPEQTKKHGGICPRCGKPLTVGVQYRVDQLADRPSGFVPKKHKKVEYIVPLAEIIAEVEGVKGLSSKTVLNKYHKMFAALGSEFEILRTIKIDKIVKAGFPKMAKAIDLLRSGKIHIEPGYDGVFGIVKVFDKSSLMDLDTSSQLLLKV